MGEVEQEPPGPGPAEEDPPTPAGPVRERRTSQPKTRRRRRRRRLLLGLGLALAVVGGLGVWLAVTAVQAEGELELARDHAQQARTAVLAGDPATARAQARLAATSAAEARGHTSALPWTLAAHVPVVGTPVDATRRIAAAVDDLAQLVLLPASDAALALSPDQLRPAGGRVDLAALTDARPALDRASSAAQVLDAQVVAIPPVTTVPAVEAARVQLVDQVGQLASLLRDTSTAATLLPSMLGADGPRSYFVAFQTNAEARGTGGLVGAFGVLRADDGTVRLDDQAANTALRDSAAPAVDLGADFTARYGPDGATSRWTNSNLSAHFPYAGQIWRALWQRQGGGLVDGAVATDPVALGYLLGATGPVTLADGQVVDATNVVALTESEVYARFPDNAARKAYLQSISTAVLARVLDGGGGSTTAVLRALGRAAGEGRLAVWSAHPAEQAVLATTPLAQEVPDDAAPYAGLSVDNYSNGKLDYYLDRTLDYRAGQCGAGTRRSTVTVTLTNGAPAAGLPPYVTIDSRDPTPVPGTNRSHVALYATRGAELTGVTRDGVPVGASVGAERGHPVFTVDVALAPGQSTRVVLSLLEPTAPGAARTPVQPLVRPMTVRAAVPDCTEP